MIPMPIALSVELRERIESEIDKLISHPPVDGATIIKSRLPKLTKSLAANPSPLRFRLVKAARLFFDLANDRSNKSVDGEHRHSVKIRNVAIAALYYFCEIEDVIPDYHPAMGFMDDAYAFSYCLSKVKALDRAWYEKACKVLQ